MSDQDGTKTRRRGTRPGSIRQVRLRLWWAIQEASTLLDDPDKDIRMRAISALSTASGVYSKLTEAAEFQKQLDDLRKELHAAKEATHRPSSPSRHVEGSPLN